MRGVFSLNLSRDKNVNLKIIKRWIIYLFGLFLFCLSVAETRAQTSTADKLSQTQKWREDLRYLAAEMPKVHKNLFHAITRERFELLGTSFIPQHSDARILEQLIYKWQHSRRVIGEALFESYKPLLNSGRLITRQNIERDVKRMFSGNFQELVNINTA